MRWFRSAVVAQLFSTALASGQAVGGTVVDRVSGQPVAGVLVTLSNASGSVASRSVTTETGEFSLTAKEPGAYFLRTLRLGFRETIADSVDLGVGNRVLKMIALASIPVRLADFGIQAARVCGGAGGKATAAFTIWQQLAAALIAVDLAQRHRDRVAVVREYQRIVDSKSHMVQSRDSMVHVGFTSQPFITRGDDSIHRIGYAIATEAGTEYVAPDLRVVASDGFWTDHCFTTVESPGSVLLGLSFEPAHPASTRADVRGILWLDRRSLELRSMSFSFTPLLGQRETVDAGGELRFLRMKDGSWLISSWSIRTPVWTRSFQPQASAGNRTTVRPVTRLNGMKIVGGELVAVLRGRDTLWTRP